jgi:hydrogenase-4 component D
MEGVNLFLLPVVIAAAAMVGSLAMVIHTYGTVWSCDLGTLSWLAGKEALFGIRIDGLSSLMLLAITIGGFLIMLYSARYVSSRNREHPSDEGQGRYYFFMLLFVASMIGLVISPNFFQLFIFWELTTLCSWGLIAFYRNDDALRSAYKALLITHAMGLFLEAGIIIIYINTGSFAFSAINLLPSGTKTLVVVFLIIASLAKAAQFPFFTWLPTAMAAPTPASAYLHAAAMVKAGVYLVARLLISILAANEVFPSSVAFVLGGFAIVTMLTCVFLYFFQDDLKRLLAYSTIANLGYMFLGLSLGALGSGLGLRGALLHLIGHSFTKSLLFLAVGAISYSTGIRKISALSGLGKKMPLTALAFVLGALAISGVPPFNMFWSKFFIIAGAFQLHSGWGWTLGLLALIESVAGFAWFLHVMHKVIFGTVSPAAEGAQDPPATMVIPLLALMGLILFSTVFALPIIDRLVGGMGR